MTHRAERTIAVLDLAEFRPRLEAAFAEVPYPGDDRLVGCDCEECAAIAAYFRGKTWRGHSVLDLRRQYEALCLFTPEALHYFLPAFVLAELEDPDTADLIYDSLIFRFTPSGEFASPATTARNIAMLTPGQRQLIADYFQDCLEEEGEYLDSCIADAIRALRAAE